MSESEQGSPERVVDEIVEAARAGADRPMSERVEIFEAAHRGLRAQLDGAEV